MKKLLSVSQNKIEEKWFLVDAKGQRIGRVASVVAELLLGKTNPLVRSNLDPKTKVIVINAEKVDITEKRKESKFLKRYSGYPSGLKQTPLKKVLSKFPERPIEHAVRGMLPRNKRGDKLISNLRVFAGESHPHEAQSPQKIEVNKFKL